jgi:N-methylhydantoinase A
LIGEGIVDNLSFDCCPYLGEDSSEALKETREIYLGEKMNVQVYDSSLMGYGNRLSGPAIVEAATTTILISPFYDLTCDKQGNYLLHSKGTSLEECLSKVRNDQ